MAPVAIARRWPWSPTATATGGVVVATEASCTPVARSTTAIASLATVSVAAPHAGSQHHRSSTHAARHPRRSVPRLDRRLVHARSRCPTAAPGPPCCRPRGSLECGNPSRLLQASATIVGLGAHDRDRTDLAGGRPRMAPEVAPASAATHGAPAMAAQSARGVVRGSERRCRCADRQLMRRWAPRHRRCPGRRRSRRDCDRRRCGNVSGRRSRRCHQRRVRCR